MLPKPVQHDEFIKFDEEVYVTENPHVRQGLTGESFLYAFTSSDAGFWHPLTCFTRKGDNNGEAKNNLARILQKTPDREDI